MKRKKNTTHIKNRCKNRKLYSNRKVEWEEDSEVGRLAKTIV